MKPKKYEEAHFFVFIAKKAARMGKLALMEAGRPSVLLFVVLCTFATIFLLHQLFSDTSLPSFGGWDLLANSTNSRPQCARVLANDHEYVAQLSANRLRFVDPVAGLEIDCDNGIRARNFFPREMVDAEDAQFPLAQARIVYRDYVFLETELAATYSPNNWYCYSIDHKSDELFRFRMKRLSACLPNVVISSHEWAVDGGGHNVTRAHLDCLALLARPERRWEYVALLQNHDVAIKTNREMVQIYRWLNGANDVEVVRVPGGRVDESLDWHFDAIRMFRNASRNLEPNGDFPPKLLFAKGYVQSSLSRKMVEFMLYDLDLTETVRRLESGGFGIDEILVPTLHTADALGAPGGFTRECLDRKKSIQTEHITRVSIWYEQEKCGSRYMRHQICIFGMEDLADKLAVWPHLFANKLLPEFDFGALLCWWEEMHRRAHFESRERSLGRLNRTLYANMPNVRFQKFAADVKRTSPKSFRKALALFNCTIGVRTNF